MIGRSRTTPSGRAPEVVLTELLGDQQRRFHEVDPGLPPAVLPPPGEVLVVGDDTAGEVAGVLTQHTWPAGSAPLLWSAAEVTELHPVLGAAGRGGVDRLLTEWRARLPARVRHVADSAAVVTWPSRDVAAARAFLDHGLVPLAVLAVRRPGPPAGAVVTPGGPPVRIRRARDDDLEACVALAMHEIAYSSMVGGSVLRPDAEAVKRTALRQRFARDEPVWLAEQDGEAVGLLECGLTDVSPGSWLAGLLPVGRWGYVNCASVLPDRRGAGVGHALVTAALPGLQPPGGRGTYLYYNPPNPISSVFWPRHGYRPLWTLWEVRPAAALR
ncbi:GNAT family N-acetyltransferase [Actinomycetospora cinnamomea]|uniref:Ribosomal protein S18 acetylase RimI-like enzyme n=1 Tax=Actinomycetospora cinnamomea TaxID=663609 RepID=A0A2U1FIE1_9PSEU|nr:GNAT family N-acetyltransferase [Actinomycetospora cinnamomea]PVZ11952.1 ribosomal protein S18 acetylase RimI-like enzyme [Actinomycetospora cinnamomea]